MDLLQNQEINLNRISYRRYWLTSFAAHFGILLFIYISNLIFPSKALVLLPSVHVDIVALPGQVKNIDQTLDTSLPVKENVTPPPAVKEEKVENSEKATAKAEPDAIAIKQQKKKNPAKEAKEALAKLKAEIEKSKREKKQTALKKFEDRYREALKGNQVHSGTTTSGEYNETTMNAYAAHVTDRLRNNWSLPTWLQKSGYRAAAVIFVDNQGNIFRYALTRSSGNDAFDSYVKSSIQRSSPFAPPPAEMAAGLRNNGMEVLFPL